MVAAALCEIADLLRQRLAFRRFADDDARFAHQPRQQRQRLLQQPCAVGRIEQREVDTVSARLQIPQRVAVQHAGFAGESGRRKILSYDLDRLLGAVDENTAVRAARERLHAELTGTGEQIQDPSAFQFTLDDGKQRLFDTVGRRAHVVSFERLQPPASGCTCNDSHHSPPIHYGVILLSHFF